MTAESTIAAAHRDPGDPKYIVPAANILACHNNNRVEANITGAVRDFLLLTNLAGTAQLVAGVCRTARAVERLLGSAMRPDS